jgi:hypothetical protein
VGETWQSRRRTLEKRPAITQTHELTNACTSKPPLHSHLVPQSQKHPDVRAKALTDETATVAFWRKGDNDLGARLRLIASSSDELEKARS